MRILTEEKLGFHSHYKIFLFLTGIFVLLFSLYQPIFETNDDVAMSMIAHGYGLAFLPSPNIMFSNVIYGWIVMHLPVIGKIYPYSYMTFFALAVVAWSLLYFLEILSVRRVYAVLFVLLILVRAVAMPQFTVNAGLLALAAITGFLTYQKTNKNFHLWLAMGLAFYSFLIRNQEFYFMILISSPLWINKTLLTHKFIFVSLGFIALCVVAQYINWDAYSGTQFANYNALLKIRVPFNDFGAAAYFSTHPELLTQYGYTVNDLELIKQFVFADNQITNPQRLGALLTHFKFNQYIYKNNGLALQAIKSIYDPSFKFLLATAVITTLLGNNKFKFILSWLLFIALVGFLGLMGRPSILRIYYPVIAMLAFLPIIYIQTYTKFFLILSSLVLLALTLSTNYLTNHQRMQTTRLARHDIHKLNSNTLYYIYAAALPYELIDLPLKPLSPTYRLYAFGSSYYLPNTFSNHYAFSQRSFNNMLENKRSFKFISRRAVGYNIAFINQYCQEHFHTTLNIIDTQMLNTFELYTIQCR